VRHRFSGWARVAIAVCVVATAMAACRRPEPARFRPTACAVQRLAVPAGYAADSTVTGGDRTGRYLVGTGRAPGAKERRLLVWDKGKPSVIDLEGADTLTDVNSAGVAVGHGYDPDGSPFSFRYEAGDVVRFAGRPGVALAINDQGVSVGYVGTMPAVWRSPQTGPELLPVPADGWRGEALDIGDDGVIVGRVFAAAPSIQSQAYVWFADGTHRFLPGSEAVSVAHTGRWAVGQTATAPSMPVRWDLRTLQSVAVTASRLVPHVVNANGSVAGSGPPVVLLDGSERLPLSVGIAGYAPDDEVEVVALNDSETLAAGTVRIVSTPSAAPIRVAVQWRCR